VLCHMDAPHPCHMHLRHSHLVPYHVHIPSTSSTDYVLASITDIVNALQNLMPNSPLAPLSDSHATALQVVMATLQLTMSPDAASLRVPSSQDITKDVPPMKQQADLSPPPWCQACQCPMPQPHLPQHCLPLTGPHHTAPQSLFPCPPCTVPHTIILAAASHPMLHTVQLLPTPPHVPARPISKTGPYMAMPSTQTLASSQNTMSSAIEAMATFGMPPTLLRSTALHKALPQSPALTLSVSSQSTNCLPASRPHICMLSAHTGQKKKLCIASAGLLGVTASSTMVM